MKLPVIKSLGNFIEHNDEDYIQEAVEVLEHISEVPSLSEEELNVVGELISNMYGALEVQKDIKKGVEHKKALNGFMQRVMGSIDQ